MKYFIWFLPAVLFALAVSAYIWPGSNIENAHMTHPENGSIVALTNEASVAVEKRSIGLGEGTNIFGSRQGAGDMEDSAPLSEEIYQEELDFRFVGLVQVKNLRLGYFENIEDRSVQQIKIGESIGQWKLVSLDKSSANLTRQNERERLRLYASQR